MLFAAGQIFEWTFETGAGAIGFLAEVEIVGTTLILRDVAVYPTGIAGSLQVGAGEVLEALGRLESLALSQGFGVLQITATRLTGAHPGRAVRIRRSLQ